MTQADALRILKTGANVFLTGEPGSGKTHTVNAYVAWLRTHDIEPSLTASTGIAATHIGGMTIHAWSGIGVRDALSAGDLDAIASKEPVVRRIQKARVLIIDEVSMLSADVLSMVDAVVREVRRNDRPFGALQVVLVGDFFQLPPVGKAGRSASFAFLSPAWSALNPLPLYLEEQHRHEDEMYGALLGTIRSGDADHTDLSRILSREAHPEDIEDIPHLYTHNADVDRMNAERLAALPGAAHVLVMETSGAPVLIESLKRGCLSPERLELKEGAVVMFTKNNQAAGYANGTLGTVTGFERGTGYPLVETHDGRTLPVAPAEWVIEENGAIRAKLLQTPLRLAWALTVHKSQGASMDAAAIDLSRAFEYGQGYVALSRLRTLAGLYLTGWNDNALAIHPSVRARDAAFRAASDEAARVFASLEETGEREELEERFILASGGSREARSGPKPPKASTYDETLALIGEGKSLDAIATERGMTRGTIIAHLEKLMAADRIAAEDVRELAPERIVSGLSAIARAFAAAKTTALTPVFKKLNGRYTYDELRLARLLI